MADLTSRADSWSEPLKLVVCISAKVAVLNALAGRFTHHVTLSDVDPASERDKGQDAMSRSQIQSELDLEQQRVARMRDETSENATRWLQVLTKHLGIDMRTLPDDPGLDTNMREVLGLEDDKRDQVAFELVLVSLALVVGDAQEIQEKAKPKRDKEETPPLKYTALSRSLIMRTCAVLGLPPLAVVEAEKVLAQHLYFEMQEKEKQGEKSSTAGGGKWNEASQQVRQETAKKTNTLKWAATGAGFVLGGVAIGLTGGLAAPAIAGVLGTVGIASFSGAGGAIVLGTLLGLGGVVASGFLIDESDSVEPWRPTFRDNKNDVFALKADSQAFLSAGRALDNYVRNYVIKMGGIELVKKTALAAAYAAVALPLTIWNTTTLMLDSDFTRCRDKAKKAGVLLAEILEKQVQGKRPAVLIGYGPGATIIFHCLLTLHERCLSDLVYSATLISLPESPSRLAWAKARSVVSHELVNTYSTDDYVAAIAARLFTLSPRIAALTPVNIEGVRDVDTSDLVHGHLELRDKVTEILNRVAEGDTRERRMEEAHELISRVNMNREKSQGLD
ncbi:hypothetical protein OIV83_006337 [Microbotryomycetes sp. JL201]|nr:hypothetical protein OIV83_006337 [Microbotryomycetes sp. JL201]